MRISNISVSTCLQPHLSDGFHSFVLRLVIFVTCEIGPNVRDKQPNFVQAKLVKSTTYDDDDEFSGGCALERSTAQPKFFRIPNGHASTDFDSSLCHLAFRVISFVH